jgi:predicted nuclease with RNAse H fold
MFRYGYPVFPPRLPAMEKLVLCAMELVQQIRRQKLHIIEVHPTSTRKALVIPTKNWQRIQNIFIYMGLKGDLETRVLTSHEIDAVTAGLTGYLYLRGKTDLIGDEEDYIVVPTKRDWRRLRL